MPHYRPYQKNIQFFLAGVSKFATSERMARPKLKTPSDSPVSIRLYPEQKKKLKEVSRKVRLSEQDCMRKALDFGLPILTKTILAAQQDNQLPA
jgi:hypothetical protein